MDNDIKAKLLASNEEHPKDLKRKVWIESKKFWEIAFPAIIARVTSFGTIVITQSYIGKFVGPTEMAAYALVQTFLVRFANGILLGMASALETLCGQAYGAEQYHMMGIYMQRSWVVVNIACTLMVPFFIFATPIFRLLGQTEELSVASGKFALWFIPILYNFVFNITLQMFLQSQLKNAITAWLSFLGFILHLFVSWLFVDYLSMGVTGAMVALIISSWAVILGQLIYVVCGWCPGTWTGLSNSAFAELFPVVKLSVSSGFMLCLEFWYNAILVLLAGYMKDATTSIAAFSICLNIAAWQLMIFFGFLTAACVRVANELGRGDAKAAKFSVIVIMTTSLILGVIFTIISLAFGDVLSYAFTSDKAVAKAVSSLSVLLAMTVFLNSIQPVLTGVAVGAGWQTVVAYVNLISYYIIGIPAGVVLAYTFHLEVNGVWIGMTAGIAVQTLVLIYMTWRTDWDDQVEKALARLQRWYVPASNDPTETAYLS
ncbi:hypothetical protein ACHQM5_004871 [Ranunculus cassubicifolius]